jgi:hypothetical protein
MNFFTLDQRKGGLWGKKKRRMKKTPHSLLFSSKSNPYSYNILGIKTMEEEFHYKVKQNIHYTV